MATTDGKKTGGRVKGTQNKASVNIREAFKNLIENNLAQIEEDLITLKPEQRIKALTELSKFCVPTLKAVELNDITPKEKEQKHIVFVKKK